jgi:hypothetical protein
VTARLLPRYYWYQAVSTATLFQAVFFVYYGERAGLSLATIQSFSTALRAVLDLPLGALADRASRRLCLVGSSSAIFLGAAGLLVWPSLPGACVAEALFAVAYALRSGAALAWSLDERRPAEHEPHAARGRMPAAARLAWRTPAIRWTLAVAVLAVTASHVYLYLQQPYLRAAGVPLALFGVVFAATKLVTASVAASAHRIDAVLGQRAAVGLMTTVPVCGLGAMAAVSTPAGALLILSRGLLDGLWMPLVNVSMNSLVDSRLRATMLSLQSVLSRLVLSAALAALGVATARLGLRTTLAVVAALIAMAGGVLHLTKPPVMARLTGGRATRP